MGCKNPNDKQIPTLICFYETGNEIQKNYCLKLKENYNGSKPIKYEIKQIPQVSFSIKLRINGKLIEIEKIFDNREEAMKETLKKIEELIESNGEKKDKVKEKGK